MRKCWPFAAILAVLLIGSGRARAQTAEAQLKVEVKLAVPRLVQGVQITQTLRGLALATLEWHVEKAQDAAAFIRRLIRPLRMPASRGDSAPPDGSG